MQAAGGKEACLAQRTTAVVCVVLLPGKLCVHRSTTPQLCSTQNVNDAHLPQGHVALLKQQAMLQTLACNCMQWVADLRVTDKFWLVHHFVASMWGPSLCLGQSWNTPTP